jgi:N-dimethylarginine dimethylaminohydrolase
MYHITIRPTTFRIEPYQRDQNPFVEPTTRLSMSNLLKDHRLIERALPDVHSYTFDTKEDLPDMVFTANAGLSLMNLPEKVLILPSMKFPQRQRERPYIEAICEKEGIRAIPFPSSNVFEGQAEAKWFHGGALLVCTYGHRSTRHTFTVLQQMLQNIYTSYSRPVPRVVAVPIESFDYYHTDIAMLEFDQTSCIVHGPAFSARSLGRLREVLGADHVHVIHDADPFCLNAIVDGDRVLTHRVSADTRATLERITGRKVVPFDTSITELSGGSVRCMVLDIHPVRPTPS